jgi:exopolysaccharide production protein ExoZ
MTPPEPDPPADTPIAERPSVPKLGNVQALRAIAVMMVFAVHVGNPFGFEPRYLGGASLLGWVNLPGQAGVDLFFVISGLIMTVTTWNAASGLPAARKFMSRRVRRIYPIYWVVSLLVLAIYLVSPTLVNSHSTHTPELLQSFTLLPQPGLPLLAVGWTLTYEMYFYLIFAVALLVGRRWLLPILGVWGVITFTLSMLVDASTTSSPWLHILSNPLSFEFVLGVGVGYLVMSRPPIAPGRLLAAGVVAFVAAAALAGELFSVEIDAWYRTLTLGPAAALIVLGAIGLEKRRTFVAPQRLQFVGDASYSIYLWHTLLLVAAGKVISFVLPSVGGAMHVVLLIAVPIAVLAATLVLYQLVEKPLIALMQRRPWARAQRARARRAGSAAATG